MSRSTELTTIIRWPRIDVVDAVATATVVVVVVSPPAPVPGIPREEDGRLAVCMGGDRGKLAARPNGRAQAG